jgi:hypothetical protein
MNRKQRRIQGNPSLVDRLKERIAELEHDNAILLGALTYSKGGGKELIEENAQLRQEVNRLQDELKNAERVVNDMAAPRVMKRFYLKGVEPGCTIVGISAYYGENEDKNGFKEITSQHWSASFNGSIEDAKRLVSTHIPLLITDMTLPSDFRSPGYLPGVTESQWMDVFKELRYFRYVATEEEDKSKKSEIFNRLWDEVISKADYPPTRNTALDHFHKFINRTFEEAEQRYRRLDKILS